MISSLKRQNDGSLELTITVDRKRIDKAYEQTLTALTKKTDLKGFRKGKAPKKLVEEKLGKQKINEELLKTLVTEVYLEAIKEQKIKPIVSPKIKILSMEEGKDWQFQAITCELPEINLDNYREDVKKALASEKIWVPGKDKEDQSKKEETQDEKLEKIFQTLLSSVKFDLPAMLTEDEVNRMLARLIEQTEKLGVTVEQYLASVNKTAEQLRAEYQKQAEQSMKLELILSTIAEKEKIEIKNEEVEKMIQAVPEENTRQNLQSPGQKAYIKQVLRKRAVIDRLLKL